MIFVHGFGTDQTAWSKVAQAFSNDYRIVLLDNVGAGKSDMQAFVQSRYQKLDKYADDVLDICDALNIKNAILIGHSVGGMISILSGVRSPECFSKIIVIGTSPCYLNSDNYFGGLTNADVRDIYYSIQQNHREWSFNFARMAMKNPDQPELVNNFAKTLMDIPVERILTVLHSIFQIDYREEISKLNVRSLIIQAQEDSFVPMQVAEFLHEKIKDSKLELIHAAGHLPHITSPQIVIPAISKFIN